MHSTAMADEALIRRTRLRSLKLTPTQLAAKLGKQPSYYSDLMNLDGKKSFGEKTARKIEEGLELPPRWLDDASAPDGDQLIEWSDDDALDRHRVKLSRIARSLPVKGVPLDQPVSHSPPRFEATIRVPLLAVEASMGPGADLQGEDVMVGTLSLNPEWISSTLRPARADALRFIHGYGDSMAPTFNSGDVLLVDSEAKDVKTDGVYVLRAHERLFIKRVRQRLDGVYEISSDNPAHKTVDVLNGESPVDVVGRVIWVWNGRKM